MKQLKRYGLIAGAAAAVIAVIFLLFFRPSAPQALEVNLLKNGDFSQLDSEGNPVAWYKDAYAGLSGAVFDVETGEDGPAAHIVNRMPKDARFVQEVEVNPNSLYRLHGYILADAEGGRGANLSIAGGYYFSESVYDTRGEWQEVTLYGRTADNQREVAVYVRLGGYSGEATGQAWFRDVTLCRVDGIPDGFSAAVWKDTFSGASNDSEDAAKTGGNASLALAASIAAYLLFFTFLCRYLRIPRETELTGGKRLLSSPWTAAALLLLACALRVALALLVPGYDVDMGCFRAWANRMAATGPANFYDPENPFSFCDYPPGYIWLLGLSGLIGKWMGTGATEFLVKLPPILADLALCAVLYQYVKKYFVSAPAALALALLYALNPLVLVTGAAWGQADALMTLLLFLTVLYAVRGQWKAALPLYAAAVLFKPQALMFGPLGLLALILDVWNVRKDQAAFSEKLKHVLLGLGFSVLTALVIVVSFSVRLSWDWLFTLYGQTMGRYAYATVNSCNLYFLLGKNWVSAESNISADFWIPALAVLLTALPAAWAWLGKKNPFRDREERRLPLCLGAVCLLTALASVILSLLGQLTYASLGTVMILHCVAMIALLYIFGNDMKNLPVFGAALLLLLFTVGPMMHERYLFPAAALLLLGYALKRDVRILWLALGVTVAGFLNVGAVLDRNIRIGGAAGHLTAPAVALQSDMALWEYLSAALNCAVCCFSLGLCAALSRGESLALSPDAPEKAPLPKEQPLPKMTRLDWILLAAVTAVYACITFTNLGATKSPQTAFVSVAPEEQIVLDLGESRDFNMLYFGGIHQYDSDFTVEIGEDGEFYDQSYTAGLKVGDCFKWKYLSYAPEGTYPAALHGRYVRITADHYDLTLFETLFQEPETRAFLPAQLVSDQIETQAGVIDPETGLIMTDGETGLVVTQAVYTPCDNETAAFLADEPGSMEGGTPSWFNSTYFDEIYHARTAYEHLHKMTPYEFTHPPLGKVMMSWAIAIFGMTPFGWRFAGALAGVLMLPGMYLLGRLLTKRSFGGMGAAMLLAFDLMHFTQTRIATIDSFVVLWIIWMVYFMLRWFFLDFFRMPFWKTLIPLALSGLCMGLAVASKWTGCYAGVALGLLFFWGIFRRWRLVRAAQKIPEKQRSPEEAAAAEGGKLLLITVASCLVFFVLVPALVYYCAYIPFFAYDGVGVTVSKVIHEAERMLGYHSQPGLGMNHDFYSPWYEWPVIAKPMWYASGAFEPAGYQLSITAMGNPALWWGGLLCILILVIVWAARHVGKDGSCTFGSRSADARPGLILIMYFVQLIPWILVPRGTYIYHYFPCVPFLALAIVLCLDLLADRGAVPADIPDEEARAKALLRRKRLEITAVALLAVVLIAAAALFFAFFPYASGRVTPQNWMDAMKWFDRWLWY